MVNKKSPTYLANQLPYLFSLFLVLTVLLIPNSAFSQSEDKISLEELSQSKAAQLFQSGDYANALAEFQKLSQEYPNDTLPRRYVAMTLILLGRLDESVTTFQEALKQEPDNPALHYFLARAYHEQGAKAKAEAELNEVIKLDPEGFYGAPAKKALGVVKERAVITLAKPWILYGSVGYEYDSNVSLNPNDKSLAAGDQSAGRYAAGIGGTYKWYEKKKFSSRAGYRFYKSLHDDGLNEFNYTFNEFSLDNQYATKQFGKDIVYRLLYKVPFGFLGGELFSFSPVELTGSVAARLTPNTRTELYHQYSHIEFGPDGSVPRVFSRDGEYNQTGVLHRYYFSNFRKYVFAGYYISPINARGKDYDSLEQAIQAGFHTPVPYVSAIAPKLNELLLDIWAQFLAANYYHFVRTNGIEPLRRLDENWSLLTTLTYPINANWSLYGSYRYVNANNRNDFFQYDRHIATSGVRFVY